MIEIKLWFYILGTFFLVEQPSIMAPKAFVTINPENKTVRIEQVGLFSLSREIDIHQNLEYRALKAGQLNWVKEMNPFLNKKLEWEEKPDQLKAIITFQYHDPKDLEIFGLFSEDKALSIFKKRTLKVLSKHYTQDANYYTFDGSTKIEFVDELDHPGMYDPATGKITILPAWRDLPVLGRKSDQLRGITFDAVQQPSDSDSSKPAAVSIVFPEDGNQLLIHGKNGGNFLFRDNEILEVKLFEEQSQLKPFSTVNQSFSYQYDPIALVLTLRLIKKDGLVDTKSFSFQVKD